ncbi:MAG TPA: hypothetical protein VGL86_04065 [Polyangia bacterium]
MPTVFLILLAVMPDLRLTADIVGLRVQARLANDTDDPVSVVVGDTCAGPLYKLIVDGKSRPFVGTGKSCSAPHLYSREVPAHGEYAILSDALDGRHHTISVRFGALVSPPIVVPTYVRVDLALAATAHARAGQPIDLEVTHVNRSAEEITVPSCGEDRLLIDGAEIPLPLTAPCAPSPRVLELRGAFITRGRLPPLAPGRHLLRARWRDTQSADAIVEVAP